MKFPRTAKILRSQFDAAPFAAVLFALLILLMLAGLMPVAGLKTSVAPPVFTGLPGTEKPSVAIAVDDQGRLYYENQIVSEQVLRTSLAAAAQAAAKPLTLVIHADKTVTYEQLARLTDLARSPGIGITNLLLATLPASTGQP